MKSKFYSLSGSLYLLCLLLGLFQSQRTSAQQFLTTIDGWNAYVHLPAEYADSPSKSYPLICFIPGIGEIGTDPGKLLLYGPSRFVSQGHNMEFTVNGKLEKPIVISIQPASAWPSAWTLNRKLDSIVARWRCDIDRLNVTGLSMGGWSWENYVDGYTPQFTTRIASVVAMSAPEPDNTIGNMRQFAQAGGKWWGFEGTGDYRKMDLIRDTMNRYISASARYYQYSGGHCCWNTWYDPTWKENGESIYTWMLKQKRQAVVPTPNIPPTADAGRDSSTIAIIPSVNLKGFANDPDGNTISIRWTKIAGPAGGTLANANTMQTSVSGLGFGSYKFELVVVDTLGAIGKDTVVINNGFVAVPVTLTSVNARLVNQKVLVEWKTLTEINSSHFIVEKSTDGQSFSNIGTVTAAGYSNDEKQYQLTDALPGNGINYYRLKMIDRDGQSIYSNIVTVNIKDLRPGSVAITTALSGGGIIQLSILSDKAQPASLVITDITGRKHVSMSLTLQKGINKVDKAATLSKGVYYANLHTTETRISTPLLSQ